MMRQLVIERLIQSFLDYGGPIPRDFDEGEIEDTNELDTMTDEELLTAFEAVLVDGTF